MDDMMVMPRQQGPPPPGGMSAEQRKNADEAWRLAKELESIRLSTLGKAKWLGRIEGAMVVLMFMGVACLVVAWVMR